MEGPSDYVLELLVKNFGRKTEDILSPDEVEVCGSGDILAVTAVGN